MLNVLVGQSIVMILQIIWDKTTSVLRGCVQHPCLYERVWAVVGLVVTKKLRLSQCNMSCTHETIAMLCRRLT